MTEKLTHNPERITHLSEGLDFYKLTMGQVALERFNGNTEVTFTLKNRALETPLSKFVTVERLNERLEAIRERGFSAEETAYFAGIQAQDGSARFSEQYLDFLADVKLPKVSVSLNPETNELDVSTTGNWAAVSLWETVVMSEINEEYYARKVEAEGLDIKELHDEADRRLNEKITVLSDRPDIKFSDFGTRRRFSAELHEHIVGRLIEELPNNFVGTSNPWFAYKFGVKPIGTYAHEMPMVYAALEDKEGGNPLNGHTRMMGEWYDRYGEDLSIALTDTFTSEFFFADFTPEQAEKWRGLRHDSGDPFEFGERVIQFYEGLGIDPTEKTIIFSDGLDIDMIVQLADRFKGRINLMYGWGTSLMNDLGLRPNNFVMKATYVNDTYTVKLSDAVGKHTGPVEVVNEYIEYVDERVEQVRESVLV